jgi:hypothetical protein
MVNTLSSQDPLHRTRSPVKNTPASTLLMYLLQELPGLKSQDHQAAELLHHTVNGLLYASPRSSVITLQHFCRVKDAVTARQQQHGSRGSSSSGGCRQLPTPTWQFDAVVNGRDDGAAPDLSTLQGTMQAS